MRVLAQAEDRARTGAGSPRQRKSPVPAHNSPARKHASAPRRPMRIDLRRKQGNS